MFRKSHKIFLGRTVDVLGSLCTLELTNLSMKLQWGNYFSWSTYSAETDWIQFCFAVQPAQFCWKQYNRNHCSFVMSQCVVLLLFWVDKRNGMCMCIFFFITSVILGSRTFLTQGQSTLFSSICLVAVESGLMASTYLASTYRIKTNWNLHLQLRLNKLQIELMFVILIKW